MKLIIGNIVLGAMLLTWYVASGGRNDYWIVAGTVLLFVAFASGTCLGSAINESPKKGSTGVADRRPRDVDTSAFENIG
jgi:hypothetical protein